MAVVKKATENPKSTTVKVNNLLKEAQFHGSNRLADRKYRLIWLVVLAIMFAASLCIVNKTLRRFLSHPTFITQKGSHQLYITFPSVIICPEISYADYKMDAFVKEINFPPGFNVSNFRKNLRQLAAFYAPDVVYNVNELEMIHTVLNFNNLDVESAGKRLSPTCEEVVLRCRLMGKMKNCTELFRMMMTQFGFCCVFNGRSLKREIMLYGIHNVTPEQQYLTNLTGPMSGLMTVVNTSQEQNNIDLTYKWVVIQGGQYYVESMANGTALASGKELWLGYAWNSFNISNGASNLGKNMRKCRLSNEVLNYFPIYSKWYCLVECEMARALRLCKCLRVTHPQPPGTYTCRVASLECAKRAAGNYPNSEKKFLGERSVADTVDSPCFKRFVQASLCFTLSTQTDRR